MKKHMYALEKIKLDIAKKINQVLKKNLVKASDLVYPTNPEFGDLSLPCFELGKILKKAPVQTAEWLLSELAKLEIYTLKVVGPYLNFTLNKGKLTKNIIQEIIKENENFGENNIGKGKKIIVEFAHPNTHKAFHIGHLRNIITGESIVRILEANGYKIIRANFQGDIGLHIAKCLWGVKDFKDEYKKVLKSDVSQKATFLGKAYAHGSNNFESNEEVKKEIIELNKKIYLQDKSIKKLYQETRQWSLDYFNRIYKRVKTKFDRLYFESEVFASGKKIVLENFKKGIFKKSEGAIIFEGEKYGLHNRVFINSEGNPTYEAKDMGLAKIQFKEYGPIKIIHVVAPEQSEYFKVVFKALELIMPKSKGREVHLAYGWVKLKEGKMSSRTGEVVLGEWLLDEVKTRIAEIAKKNLKLQGAEKEISLEKIGLAAVKYSILKNGLAKEISFDLNESISLSGSSGPYLQYTYARIRSIIRKSKLKKQDISNKTQFDKLSDKKESLLILKIAKYPEIVEKAGINYEPSEIAKYLFELTQEFNDYYHSVSVLQANEEIKNARLALIDAISQVIYNGLNLLGIETLEEM